MHACSLHSSQCMPRFWNARKGACHVEAKKYNGDLVLWLHQALKEKVCERCQMVLALDGSFYMPLLLHRAASFSGAHGVDAWIGCECGSAAWETSNEQHASFPLQAFLPTLQTQKEGRQRQQRTQVSQLSCGEGASQACEGCPDPASGCSTPRQSLKGAKGCPAPGQGTWFVGREAYVTMSTAGHPQALAASTRRRPPRSWSARRLVERLGGGSGHEERGRALPGSATRA